MRCSQCQHEGSPTAKFCEACGTPLANSCPGCGRDVGPQARFCPECGQPLGAAPPAATPDAPVGERRQLTVLFCDLVGSTEIAAQLDPEDWHRISKEYQDAAAEAVRRFGGHVDKFLGDGLVCFFGVPQAHEDDAERAVRAGLAIVEGVRVLGVKVLAEEKEASSLTPNTLTPNT